MMTIAKNSKGEILNLKFFTGWCCGLDLIEIISMPNDAKVFYCYNNKIEKLPDLRTLEKLIEVGCDIQCFEPYMLEMENTHFHFVC